MEVLKISSSSNSNSTAGVIAQQIKEYKKCELRMIGAGALNQGMKAIIIAKGYLAPMGINIVCVPSFTDIVIDDNTITGIKLVVKVEN